MSAGDKKRKRSDNPTEQPAKVLVVENHTAGTKSTPPAKSKGKSRQEKSERRSKKLAKRNKSKESPLRSHSRDLSTEAPELFAHTSDPANEDSLANGEDFVSLGIEEDTTPVSIATTKSKKKKKKKDGKKKSNTTAVEEQPATSPSTNNLKKDRFILFIGNLPFTATTSSITHHFRALQPLTVRHNTDKKTGRSKGFAFLEFENYDRLKTCLKIYHHSIFDPDAQSSGSADNAEQQDNTPAPAARSKSNKTRRINVEVTAGGGGKSEQRKSKIEMKNKKLTEERGRRHQKEAAERTKAAEEYRQKPTSGANAEEPGTKKEEQNNIHPSRMKRVTQ